MPVKNQNYTVEITDLNNLGFGVAKIGGVSVFIADTVTGDTAEIRIIKTAKTYAVGTLVKLLTPSPMRLPAGEGCPVSRRCGGCVYQKVGYGHELVLKRNYVAFAMKKAGAEHVNVLPVLSTGETEGYRNKAQYPVGANRDGKMKIGFYAAKSHDIIPSDACSLQPPVFGEICTAVREFCESHRIPAYDETKKCGCLRHIYLREAKKTGEILLCLVTASAFPASDRFCQMIGSRFPLVVGILENHNADETNVVLGEKMRVLWGRDYMEDVLCGLSFRVSPQSFYQVNHDGTELLYSTAKKLLALRPGETLLDLYCGIGTIGLSMIAGFGEKENRDNRLIGIEIVPEAIGNAKENARRNGIGNASFFCGDASDAKTILAGENLSADAVIVDPPRKGLTPEVISYLAELSPSRIVYISCDADTLARDIVRFEAVGYHTDTAQPVDMFSRTGHVETVVLLSQV